MQEMTMHYKKDVTITDAQTVQWPVLWKVTLLSFSWRNWLSVFQENSFKNSLQYTAKPKWCTLKTQRMLIHFIHVCVQASILMENTNKRPAGWTFAVSTQMLMLMVNRHKLAEFGLQRKTKECKNTKIWKTCWVTWIITSLCYVIMFLITDYYQKYENLTHIYCKNSINWVKH